jgi:hypothetical protein
MLDLIFIQDKMSGIKLFEFQGAHTLIDSEHALIFSGFLSAIQCISSELKIGELTQISTDSHHCIIHCEGAILVIIIIDISENALPWKHKASIIGREFNHQYLKELSSISDISAFKPFNSTLSSILTKF